MSIGQLAKKCPVDSSGAYYREFHALHNPYLGLQKNFQKKPKNAEEYYSKAPFLTSIHEISLMIEVKSM